jgi:NTE family protein
MANLYWKDYAAVHPAKFVRASMSIPGFFHPFTLHDIPNDAEAKKRWKDDVRYDGPVPKTVRFVDGGMLSNFPINAFHVKSGNNPTRPTFGVRLSAYRKEESKTDKLGGYAGAMINTMRQSLDFEFLLRNPDYRQLICRVDADEQFNWLDFNMPEEKKKALFALGCAKAITFLEEWHESGGWDAYLEFRKSLL